MLLNKIPCLDRGYVAYVDSCNNLDRLKDLAMEFFKSSNGYAVSNISNLTLIIKCPLFVQLNLSTHNLTIITTPANEVEAYCPNLGEIGGKDRETNRLIADDIERTTEALLINPKAYQHDGCDRFVAQILTPLSVYTTLIVHGSYEEWKKFCGQGNLPTGISAYADAVKQIMGTEWR